MERKNQTGRRVLKPPAWHGQNEESRSRWWLKQEQDRTDRECSSWDYFISENVPLYIFGPETCCICGSGTDQELAYSIIDTLMVGGPVCCLTLCTTDAPRASWSASERDAHCAVCGSRHNGQPCRGEGPDTD